jgi:hypothetical protein
VPHPELSPQALDQLVVPLVVRARAAALDEQDLPSTCHGDPLSRFRDDPNRYARWPDSLGGGAGPARDVKQPARGFDPFDHKNKEVFSALP